MNSPWAEWLSRQRWYAGKNRTVHHIDRVVTTIDDSLDHVVLNVAFDDGFAERYQVFVGWDRVIPEEYVGVSVIGDIDGRTACDALYDESACQAILELMRADATRDSVRFVRESADDLEFANSRVSDAEQSNTSVIFDDLAILKVFRRVVTGLNPDLELSRALAHAGNPHVAKLLGSIEDADTDGQPRSLGILTEFARNSAEGWAMALTSARDLLASAGSPPGEELQADEMGGDFAAEAYRLGEAVASVHKTLAETMGTEIGPPPNEHLIDRLEVATAEVPELLPYLAEAREIIARADVPTMLQRVHGDLHLGQVLRTPDTWILIDFEGEPGQPIAERRRLASPIRDVAAMLRSFDYAAHYLLVDFVDDEASMNRAQDWAERNRDAFCEGYASVSGTDPRSEFALLQAYELDKAIYEVAYEARHRPNWLWIPMRSLSRLLPSAR